MSEVKHTPLPWAKRPCYDELEFEIYPLRRGPPDFGDWAEVAVVRNQYDNDETEAAHNADLILRAVNNHYELLAVAKRCLRIVEDGSLPNWDWIREVIAKAEGRTP
jgi:hypothetical protein